MANRIQLRRGTAAQWTAANPVLAQGEPGVESDSGKMKFGNGVTAWLALPYASKGDPGPAGVADDASVEDLITTPGTATATALNATYGPEADGIKAAIKTEGAKSFVTREAVPGSVLSPMSIFRAWAQKRDTAPVVVAFAGMSIVQGTDAGGEAFRFTTLLSDALQAAYPLASGTPSPAIKTLAAAVTTPPSEPGVQVVNAGLGGTVANNFLTSTTRPQLAALNPRMVIGYIGVNDWHAGVPAATYKADLAANLEALRALITTPCTYVLIHGHPRTSSTSTVDWDEYGVALRELAALHPENTLLVDLYPAYKQIGIYKGGTDPIGIMSDTVHPNAAGHAFLADLLRGALEIPAGGSAVEAVPAVVIASDTFSGGAAGDINTRVADNTYGGIETRTWSSLAATAVAVTSSGTIGRGAGAVTFFAGIQEESVDERFKFTLSTLPVGSALTLDFRRASDSASGTVDAMRLNIGSVGSGAVLSLISRVGGVSTTIATWGAVALNSELEIRTSGGTVSVYKNGAFVGSGSIPSALASFGWIGFSGTASLTSWGVSDVILSEG